MFDRRRKDDPRFHIIHPGRFDVDPEPHPEPRPHHRRKIIRIEDDPWTERELELLVEQAIQYIQKAQVKWGSRLGLTVGEWLYVNLFLENDAYMRSQNPMKKKSLYDIASETPYYARTLRTWVWAGRMKVRLERDGFSSERLTLTDWSSLYQLRDHPEAARQVAQWVHRDNPPVELVQQYVREWRKHLEREEDDPERKPDPPDPPEPPDPPDPHRRRRRPDELRLIRVLRLVRRWVKETELSSQARRRLLMKIEKMQEILERRG